MLGGDAAARRRRRAPPAPVRIDGRRPPGGRGRGAAPAAQIYVHVAGAVRRPGLIGLPAGARVATALERAGGPGARADLTAVNLAAQLKDGQQIVVPRAGRGRRPRRRRRPRPGPRLRAGAQDQPRRRATVEQLDAARRHRPDARRADRRVPRRARRLPLGRGARARSRASARSASPRCAKRCGRERERERAGRPPAPCAHRAAAGRRARASLRVAAGSRDRGAQPRLAPLRGRWASRWPLRRPAARRAGRGAGARGAAVGELRLDALDAPAERVARRPRGRRLRRSPPHAPRPSAFGSSAEVAWPAAARGARLSRGSRAGPPAAARPSRRRAARSRPLRPARAGPRPGEFDFAAPPAPARHRRRAAARPRPGHRPAARRARRGCSTACAAAPSGRWRPGLPAREAALLRGMVLGQDEAIDARHARGLPRLRARSSAGGERSERDAPGGARAAAARRRRARPAGPRRGAARPGGAVRAAGRRGPVAAARGRDGRGRDRGDDAVATGVALVRAAAGRGGDARAEPARRAAIPAGSSRSRRSRGSSRSGRPLAADARAAGAELVPAAAAAAGPAGSLGGARPRARRGRVAITRRGDARHRAALAHHFGAVPVAGLLANLLALPAVAPAMWLGMLKAALGSGLAGAARRPRRARRAARAADRRAARVPRAAWPSASPTCPAAGSSCRSLAAGSRRPTWSLARRGCSRRALGAQRAGRGRGGRAGAGRRLAAGTALVPRRRSLVARARGCSRSPPRRRSARRRRRAELTVSFLDVGQGDATLDPAPRRHGGPVRRRAAGGRRPRLLRRAGVRRLALVVATHASRDHHGGLPSVLARYPVGLLLDGGDGTRDPGFRARAATRRPPRGRRVPGARAGRRSSAGGSRSAILSARRRGRPARRRRTRTRAAVVAIVSAGDFDLLPLGRRRERRAPAARPRRTSTR